jgi:hypothetical protein
LGVLAIVVLGWFAGGAEAQDAEELFRKVSPSVVVIRAKGRSVDGTRGLVTTPRSAPASSSATTSPGAEAARASASS